MKRAWAAASIWVVICATASVAVCCHASPREIPLQISPNAQVIDGKDIADYPRAVDAILQVLVHKFELPLPRGKVEIHQTRESFEQALLKYLKITPALAKTTAQFAKGAVGSNTLIVNEQAESGDTWPQRVEGMAHEIAHLLQLTLANQPGIDGNQWLIEGFAEWLAIRVTDALAIDEFSHARVRIRDKVRAVRSKSELPRLLRIDLFADWVEARRKFGYDATYSLSFLVTDFLIERHSIAAALNYFRGFQSSIDQHANFSAAFGETLDEFEIAVNSHLDRLLK